MAGPKVQEGQRVQCLALVSVLTVRNICKGLDPVMSLESRGDKLWREFTGTRGTQIEKRLESTPQEMQSSHNRLSFRRARAHTLCPTASRM